MGNRYKASTTGLHAGAKRGAPDPRWVVSPRHVLDPDISSPGGAMIVMYCIAFAALPKGFALLPPGSLSGWACLLAGGLLGPPSAPPLFVFCFFPLFSFLVRGCHALLGLPWETILAQASIGTSISETFRSLSEKLVAPSGAEPTTRVPKFETPLLTRL